jgi:hypothetical protein
MDRGVSLLGGVVLEVRLAMGKSLAGWGRRRRKIPGTGKRLGCCKKQSAGTWIRGKIKIEIKIKVVLSSRKIRTCQDTRRGGGSDVKRWNNVMSTVRPRSSNGTQRNTLKNIIRPPGPRRNFLRLRNRRGGGWTQMGFHPDNLPDKICLTLIRDIGLNMRIMARARRRRWIGKGMIRIHLEFMGIGMTRTTQMKGPGTRKLRGIT